MQIIKSNSYIRDFKKKILNKHLEREKELVEKIEELFVLSDTFYEVMCNPLHLTYNINKKTGDLKEYYTADVNSKIRLYIKPVGEYPYELINITKIEFNKIDDKHYGDG